MQAAQADEVGVLALGGSRILSLETDDAEVHDRTRQARIAGRRTFLPYASSRTSPLTVGEDDFCWCGSSWPGRWPTSLLLLPP